MSDFHKAEIQGDLKNMIDNIFDTKIDLNGGWGYSKEDATILIDLPVDKNQLQHNLIHMRVYIEMNIMQDKDSRYSSINIIEKSRESEDNYEKVTYEATAILEKKYNTFIDEYKENYGKDDFDISDHFKRRKEATLKREVIYWFDLSSLRA